MDARDLGDDRYALKRFKAVADGDIRRVAGEVLAAKSGRRKEAKRDTAMLNAVQPHPPKRNLDVRVKTPRSCSGLEFCGCCNPDQILVSMLRLSKNRLASPPRSVSGRQGCLAGYAQA